MNTFKFKPLARSIRFDTDIMWVEFTDGRQLGIPLAYFPRLLHASQTDRQQYILSGGGSGIHWESLDEDILVANLLSGIFDQTKSSPVEDKKVS